MSTSDTPTRRQRGKGFPSLPLDDSVAVIERIGKYGRQHSLGGFASYLGHQTTKSGPFLMKMAALSDWGLIARRGEEVTLTDLAQQIAHPESSEQLTASIQQAFFNADLFATIYRDSAKEVDLSLELVGNRAVNALGVAAQRKSQFAQSFAKSAAAAGLARTVSADAIVLLGTSAGADTDASEDLTAVPDRRPGPETSSPPKRQLPATVHEEWTVPAGVVVFEARLDRPLPVRAWAEVAKVAEAVEKFVSCLDVPPDNGRESAG